MAVGDAVCHASSLSFGEGLEVLLARKLEALSYSHTPNFM